MKKFKFLLILVIGILIFFFGKSYLKKEGKISPFTIVDQYTKATLGTIPGAKVDYEKAKEYLADNLRKQFTDLSFVPLSYGIQDGPTEVKIEKENISGNKATVKVIGFYGGEPGRIWEFNLILEQNQWKISEIKRLNQ